MENLTTTTHPTIIQGGMGIGVSNWQLARAVSQQNGLGVISGTAIDTIVCRQLQDGDIGGHYREALSQFPDQIAVAEFLRKYFIPEGRTPGQSYKVLPLYQLSMPPQRQLEIVMAAFAEVYLAKQGHSNRVGMNLLTKIQLPTLPALYGAMLAGVDYILMGAGIPKEIPEALSNLSQNLPAQISVDIEGEPIGSEKMIFDPKIVSVSSAHVASIRKPFFLPIVSSNSLATMLVKKVPGIDGLIVENHLAGGHNAPPRTSEINDKGEPVYGERDSVDFEKIRALGKPFWIAGATGNCTALKNALALGATGIQAGTIFAFSNESGISQTIKDTIFEKLQAHTLEIFTDPKASPTGFPFKIATIEGSASEYSVRELRRRACDIGLLRTACRKNDGTIEYRCASEDIKSHLKKGGTLEDTVCRACVCNGLLATVGLGQLNRELQQIEPALVTAGSDFSDVDNLFQRQNGPYSVSDVMQYLTN